MTLPITPVLSFSKANEGISYLDYGSEIWWGEGGGCYKNYPEIDAIQNKAIGVFLNIHQSLPVVTIYWWRNGLNLISCMTDSKYMKSLE